MQVPQIPGDVNQQDLLNATNNVVRELNARDVTEVFKDDTGTRRVLLGKGADGFYGVKVSKAGFDVYDTGNENLVMNSDQNMPKIVTSGTKEVPATAGSGTSDSVDLSSLNLSEPPLTIVSVKYLSGVTPFYQIVPVIFGAGATLVQASSWVNFEVGGTQTINFSTDLGASATGYEGIWTFRYYVLQESAS